MRLGHLIVLATELLVGFLVGYILAWFFFPPYRFLVGWICGLCFAAALTTFLYECLGISLPLPKCPRLGCPGTEYKVGITNPEGTELQCIVCGQLLLLQKRRVAVLHDDGHVIHILKLLKPGFLGIWR
jgi:hypothetical protein